MAVTQQTIDQVTIFTGRVDMTKTALSNRSRNLFTFSAIHQANQQLLADHKQQSVEDRVTIAVKFWNTVAANMPDWQAWEFRSATMKAAWKYHHKTPAADGSLCDIGIFRAPITIP